MDKYRLILKKSGEKVCINKKKGIPLHRFSKKYSNQSDSGCSAVRLAHLLWEQGVVGSNPATPTRKGEDDISSLFLFYTFHLPKGIYDIPPHLLTVYANKYIIL